HRRTARRHRDELLRGVDPPAGEPAARDPARRGRGLLTPPAATVRIRRLQRPDGRHRQAQSGRAARRATGGGSDGVGRPLTRDDGFSPGSAITTVMPGRDLERTGAAPETDIGRSLHANAPIVLLDATSGRRVPYWAEIDQSAPAADQRALVVRPAVNFREGH